MFNNFSTSTLHFTDSVEKAVDQIIQSTDKTIENFWNVLDHVDFPFVTLESTTNTTRNFPPYNIVDVNDGQIRLDLAVAGYTKDRLTVELQGNILSVKGTARTGWGTLSSELVSEDGSVSKTTEHKDSFTIQGTYRKQSISNATFLRTFEMQPNTVVNGVRLQDGILSVLVATTKTEVPKTTFTIT